jgi:hypothetical protein
VYTVVAAEVQHISFTGTDAASNAEIVLNQSTALKPFASRAFKIKSDVRA